MEQILQPLEVVMKRHHSILFAYLFGSYAVGEQTAMSDIDIAIFVENKKGISFSEKLLLHGDCCRALKRNDIDILVLNTTKNLFLLEDIICDGKVIYNSNQDLLDEFELKTLHKIFDFKENPLLVMKA